MTRTRVLQHQCEEPCRMVGKTRVSNILTQEAPEFCLWLSSAIFFCNLEKINSRNISKVFWSTWQVLEPYTLQWLLSTGSILTDFPSLHMIPSTNPELKPSTHLIYQNPFLGEMKYSEVECFSYGRCNEVSLFDKRRPTLIKQVIKSQPRKKFHFKSLWSLLPIVSLL